MSAADVLRNGSMTTASLHASIEQSTAQWLAWHAEFAKFKLHQAEQVQLSSGHMYMSNPSTRLNLLFIFSLFACCFQMYTVPAARSHVKAFGIPSNAYLGVIFWDSPRLDCPVAVPGVYQHVACTAGLT